MDSKERVLAAIQCQTADRLPSSFHAGSPAIIRLKRETGLSADEFMDRYDVDIRSIGAITPPDKNMGSFFENYWGERFVYHDSEYGPVRDDMDGALSSMETLEEIMAFPWVTNDDFDYSEISGLCDKYTGRAIMYGGGDIWQRPALVRGMSQFFIDMYEEPEICHFLSKKFTDFYVEDFRRAYDASNGRIDIFSVCSDLGTQRGPLISLAAYREFVAPYLKQICDAVHEMGAHLLFHSCGLIETFVPEFIAAGVDILNPIQPCDGNPAMSPEYLSEKYKGQICFNGGIDLQKVLVKGTPEDVRNEVIRYKNAFSETGYICCATHDLQADASWENIIALYEAVLA